MFSLALSSKAKEWKNDTLILKTSNILTHSKRQFLHFYSETMSDAGTQTLTSEETEVTAPSSVCL